MGRMHPQKMGTKLKIMSLVNIFFLFLIVRLLFSEPVRLNNKFGVQKVTSSLKNVQNQTAYYSFPIDSLAGNGVEI
jgi:hypothetical protein